MSPDPYDHKGLGYGSIVMVSFTERRGEVESCCEKREFTEESERETLSTFRRHHCIVPRA